MPLLSICIPVYNAQTYLTQCVEPLISMGEEAQIILSDDGSTDASAEICRAYAQAHKNVEFITGENGGPSAARNRALERVRGRYTTFVDADDVLESTAIDHLRSLTTQTKPDIIQFGVASEFGTWTKRKELLFDRLTVLDEGQRHRLLAYTCGLRDRRDLGHAYFGLASCRFYRTELLHGLRFDPTIVGEDTLYAVQALKRMKSAVFVPEYLYHYRVSQGSYSRKQFNDIVPMAAKMLDALKREVEEYPHCDRLLRQAYLYHGYDKLKWCTDAMNLRKMPRELRAETLRQILQYDAFSDMIRRMPLTLLSERRMLTVLLLRMRLYKAAAGHFLL